MTADHVPLNADYAGVEKPDGSEIMDPPKGRKVSYLSTAQLATLSHACIPLREALGGGPYLVGSSTERPDFRDVDVRSIVDDDRWDAIFGGRELFWGLFCWAVSEWLSKATGLPIDYQAQRMTEANAKYGDLGKHPRNPLGMRARVFASSGDATPYREQAQ